MSYASRLSPCTSCDLGHPEEPASNGLSPFLLLAMRSSAGAEALAPFQILSRLTFLCCSSESGATIGTSRSSGHLPRFCSARHEELAGADGQRGLLGACLTGLVETGVFVLQRYNSRVVLQLLFHAPVEICRIYPPPREIGWGGWPTQKGALHLLPSRSCRNQHLCVTTAEWS